MQDFDLYNDHGQRKYMTAEERTAFFASITPALPHSSGRIKRTYALMLYYTGIRKTEGLEIMNKSLDFTRKGVVVRTLKSKTKKIKYRFIPLPDAFLEKLDDIHHIKDNVKRAPNERLWGFGETTAWRIIKTVMAHAAIEGAQATVHGLRHSFVIAHQQKKSPPHMIQQWAGWTTTEMLAVYGRALGAEERELAGVIWE